MRIDCVPSTNRRGVLEIMCDGELWREVHTTIFGRCPQLPQNFSSLEQFAEQFHTLECQLAKRYALKRLSTHALHSARLAISLKERLVSTNAISQVIDQLAEIGILNDKEWVDSFVRVQSSKRVGPRAIAQKLAAKGVRGVDLERSSEKQKENIQHLLKTRYAKRNLKDSYERQKVIAALARRGFDLDLILSQL